MNFRAITKTVDVSKQLLYRPVPGIYLISFPKAGRTWLGLMMTRALAAHYQCEADDHLRPHQLQVRGIPKIRFSHDGANEPLDSSAAARRYKRYAACKVIFLARDPRDVVVSYYFQRTRRARERKSMLIEDFVRDGTLGISRIVAFMNGWMSHREIPKDFLLVRYEDLHIKGDYELKRVLDFCDLPVTVEAVDQGVSGSTFEVMREMELRATDWRLRAADPNDANSFKTRRGKVGTYTEALEASAVRYVDSYVTRELDPRFGYR